MRLSSALAAGLAGLMALPALAGWIAAPAGAAGPVGLDAVTQWLRGITGAPAPGDTAATTAPAPADPAQTGRPGGQPAAGLAPSATANSTTAPRRPGAPISGAADTIPLADTGDFAALMTPADPTAAETTAAPSASRAPAVTGSIGRGAGLRGAQPERGGPVRPAEPAGPQRVLPDDPQAESEDLWPPQRYRVGSVTVQPKLDAGIGRTSNMEGRAGGDGGALYRLRGEAAIASDWSRHGFEASLRAGYDGYPSKRDLNTPSYDGTAALRLDLMEATRADLALRLSSARGKASSAENPAGTVLPSTTTTTGASAGLTREAGLIGLTLRGDIDRTSYSGGELAGGGAITSDEARNNTRVAVALRASLTEQAMLRPYVEVQGIRRGYDAESMSGRDSRGVAGRVGARLDFGPLLSGEVAAGWTREMLDDASLPDLAGATVDASVLWSPTRLTQVAFVARTTLDPTTLAGSSGSIGRRAGVTLTHALRRDVIGTLGASGEQRRYDGLALKERTLTAEAELAYRFDPHIEVYGRGEWSRFTTTTPGADYDNLTVMTGVRLR